MEDLWDESLLSTAAIAMLAIVCDKDKLIGSTETGPIGRLEHRALSKNQLASAKQTIENCQ